MPPKRTIRKTSEKEVSDVEDQYLFTEEKAAQVKSKLLVWYDKNKRSLPWRHSNATSPEEIHQRAYEVWVSEIMLQQTRVETVIDYYNKWMKRFPTVRSLAEASLDEVNSLWAGLGYYRRAKHLYEAAKQLLKDNKDDNKVIRLPDDAKDLEKLSGVGRYTAGAIASIAFGKIAPLVDGNVLRVLSRIQGCNLDIANQKYHKSVFWPLATQLVQQRVNDSDELRPGDFNQSMMELGALVCTPKSAKCSSCPISDQCTVFKMKQDGKIETVEEYPVKKKKNAPQEETVLTCIFRYDDKFLCVKRPDTGLLANMWEFPSMIVKEKLTQKNMIIKIKSIILEKNSNVRKALKLKQEDGGDDELLFKYCGQVTHIFTHIKQALHVFAVNIGNINADIRNDSMKWMTSGEMDKYGVPTLVKKVLKQYQNHNNFLGGHTGNDDKKMLSKKRKRQEDSSGDVEAERDDD